MIIGTISTGKQLIGTIGQSGVTPIILPSDHYVTELFRLSSISSMPARQISSVCYALTDGITFSGSEYVMTDLLMTDATRMEIDFSAASLTGTAIFLMGGRGLSAEEDSFAMAYSSSTSYPNFGSDRSTVSGSINVNKLNTLSLSQEGYCLNGQLIKEFSQMSFTGSYTLAIGSVNSSGTVSNRCWNGSVYEVRLTVSGLLTHQLVPVVRCSDSVTGLLDLVGMNFYSKTALTTT